MRIHIDAKTGDRVVACGRDGYQPAQNSLEEMVKRVYTLIFSWRNVDNDHF